MKGFSERGPRRVFGLHPTNHNDSSAADCICAIAECNFQQRIRRGPTVSQGEGKTKFTFVIADFQSLQCSGAPKVFAQHLLVGRVGRKFSEEVSSPFRPEYRNESWMNCFQQSGCRGGGGPKRREIWKFSLSLLLANCMDRQTKPAKCSPSDLSDPGKLHRGTPWR
jgi:hypothetical protein